MVYITPAVVNIIICGHDIIHVCGHSLHISLSVQIHIWTSGRCSMMREAREDSCYFSIISDESAVLLLDLYCD